MYKLYFKRGLKMVKFLDSIILIFVLIGALNWGSVGLFQFDFISYVFGDSTFITRLIFCLVGLFGIYSIKFLFKIFSRL